MSTPPIPYTRQASFTQFATEQFPTTGQGLEGEFNKISQSISTTQSRLAEIQRDDGRLANQAVHPDALSHAVRSLLAADAGVPRGNWSPGVTYRTKDVVMHGGASYLAATGHTAGVSFDADFAFGRWLLISFANDGGTLRSDLANSITGNGASLVEYQNGVSVKQRLDALGSLTEDMVQSQIDQITASMGNGMIPYETVADLTPTDPGEGKRLAWVWSDPVPGNNGAWTWDGSGWERSADQTTALAVRLADIADEGWTFYYEGDEVLRAAVDEAGRPTVVELVNGRVKIPGLVLGQAQLQQIADASGDTLGAWPVNALEALSFAAQRPVDLVMIGDSNQAMNGYGYGSGLHKALAARFGCYATGVAAAAPSAHSEYTNNTIETLTPMSAGAYTGAGSEADAIVPPHQRLGYSYWASGELAGSTLSGVGRIRIKNGGGLDPSAPLRVHYAWISTDTGAGSFRVGARLAVSPYTGAASGTLHNTNTGEVSLHRDWLDIPAGSRGDGLEIWWARPGQTPITGPMCAVSMRVEDTAKTAGVAVSTFYAAGGQSLYDMAEYALTAPDGTLSHWFGEVRRLQVARGLKPIVVFYINSGLNDRNETSSPSLGWRGSTDPDGPEAYLDNLDALVKRIRDIWQKNGWAQEELFFLLVPSHPVSAPDDAELRSYRGACVASYAAQLGVSVVDMTNITSATEMLAEGWYQSGGSDTNHLENAGYDELSARIASLIPELPE